MSLNEYYERNYACLREKFMKMAYLKSIYYSLTKGLMKRNKLKLQFKSSFFYGIKNWNLNENKESFCFNKPLRNLWK